MPKTFAYERIRARRLQVVNSHGEPLSPTDLAARVGVSYFTLARWEHGRSKPDAEQLARLAEALDRAPSYFYVEATP